MTEKRYEVYGIGNAIMDLQVRAADESLARFGLEKGGMQLVEPDRQQELIAHFAGSSVHKASGGSAANTVIALSQLGARTAYGCVVGDDENGRLYLNEMKSLGVDLHIPPTPGGTTGTSLILITPDAERTMNTHLGASAGLTGRLINGELIAESEWLYVEGYLFASPDGQDAIRTALDFAKQFGTKVAITFSDGFIVDVFGGPLREAVGQAELIFANRVEALKFTGAADEHTAFERLRAAAPSVVMTLSERGAWVAMNGVEERVEPFPVVPVDDTGAGDMFAGGFLYGVTKGLGPRDAGRLACFLASRVVAQLGPRIAGDLRKLARDAGVRIE